MRDVSDELTGVGEGIAVVFPYGTSRGSASASDSLLQSAASSGAVAQWLELGTHNP